ncbi:hypothetical protein KDN34_16515 [Shewanella yunxiaonensis]|uniref:Uncharacterized protein n=1 Tax=Shewanella yunxiaonensis TaxID=2829809 RepID=A0ABX7YSN6_9GAMM|nr:MULTISPECIES: hypothetical protein [Shewanella]MDF0533369.1 hypothetical protein [Shewanella sp. A32]QUN05758.1 hypothetical protein KDN34_16515 [Shewanella yunxiaonensis]
MFRPFYWQQKPTISAIIGTLLSVLVFCLTLVILPVLLLLGAALLFALSLFGRQYLKRQFAKMQQSRFHGNKRDIYDCDPHVSRDSTVAWQPKGRVLEHQD